MLYMLKNSIENMPHKDSVQHRDSYMSVYSSWRPFCSTTLKRPVTAHDSAIITCLIVHTAILITLTSQFL